MIELDQLTTGDTEALISKIAHDTIKDVAASAGVGITALLRWIDADTDRTAAYIRARAAKASILADETILIADNGAAESAADPARDKLRIQARQWLAARWDRQQYGDRQDSTVSINVQSLHLDAFRRRSPPADEPLHIDVSPSAASTLTIDAVPTTVSD